MIVLKRIFILIALLLLNSSYSRESDSYHSKEFHELAYPRTARIKSGQSIRSASSIFDGVPEGIIQRSVYLSPDDPEVEDYGGSLFWNNPYNCEFFSVNPVCTGDSFEFD